MARASLEELLKDYEDHLRTRHLTKWDVSYPRLAALRSWTKSDSFFQGYAIKGARMTGEELANVGITLCHQTFYMLGQLLKTQQSRFVQKGGIKERMHAARTGYRQGLDAERNSLRQENAQLKQRIAELENQISDSSDSSKTKSKLRPSQD